MRRARVPGRDVLHASAARRRAGRRVPAARPATSTWTATLRADQACRMGEELFAKAVRVGPAPRDGRRRVGLAGDARSAAEGHEARAGPQAPPRCARATASAPSSTSSSASRASPTRACEATLALAKRLRRMNPRVRDADLLLPAVSRKPDGRTSRARDGYVFPAGPRGVGRLRLRRRPRPVGQRRRSGGRSSASSSTRATRGSRARGAGRSAPRRDGAASTTGTTCRSRRCSSSSCGRRSRCRDGYPAGARLLPRRSIAEEQRDHAAASAARPAVPVVAPEGARLRRRRVRRHLPTLGGLRGLRSSASGRRSSALPST